MDMLFFVCCDILMVMINERKFLKCFIVILIGLLVLKFFYGFIWFFFKCCFMELEWNILNLLFSKCYLGEKLLFFLVIVLISI